MFTVKFINPANSVNYTVIAEGYPVTVERSLPIDIKSYSYEGDNLVFEVEHPDVTAQLAWEHTLQYLKEQFVPERVEVPILTAKERNDLARNHFSLSAIGAMRTWEQENPEEVARLDALITRPSSRRVNRFF